MLKFSEWLVENKKEPTVNGSENLCESPKRSKDPKPKKEPEKETKPKTKKVKVSDWYFDDDGNYVPVVWKEVPITDEDSDKKDIPKKLSKEEVKIEIGKKYLVENIKMKIEKK